MTEIPDARTVAPPLPPRCVPRPRLIAAVDDAATRPLTLIAAGPGSGKTVLLSDWALSRPTMPAWVSLSASDNRPGRFWSLVAEALRMSGVEAADADLVGPPPTSIDDDMRVVDPYLFAAARPAQPLVLVLDDAHVLDHPAILDGLDSLLRAGGTRLHLVLSCRTDPMLPLHRYRLAGQMSEIRSKDLAMTRSEAMLLLGAHNVTLSPRQLGVLAERTEGWTAGLRLSAMSMENSEDPAAFVSEFALDQGSVGEYLMNEVLAQLPEDVRRLLVETSFLREVEADLAVAVTGDPTAAETLSSLSRTNAFVVPLDRTAERFRYHQLLAEILRYLLRREPPHRQQELVDRASQWYFDHDRLDEALRLDVERQDWTHAAEMVTHGGLRQAFVRRQDIRFVRRIAAAGGEGETGAHTLARAALHAAAGRPAEARSELARLADTTGLPSGGDEALTVQLTEMLVARAEHRPEELAALAVEVTSGVEDDALAAAVALKQGAAYLWTGHYDETESALLRALELADRLGDARLRLHVIAQLTLFHAHWGRFALSHAEDEQAVAIQRGRPRLAMPGALHLARVIRAYYRADFRSAFRFLHRAETAVKIEVDPDVRAAVPVLRGMLLAGVGQVGAAQAALAPGDQPFAAVTDSHRLSALADIETSLGRPTAAVKLLNEAAVTSETSDTSVALARAYLALGELTPAEAATRRVLTSVERPTTRALVVEALVTAAQISAARSNTPKAVENLIRACELAAGEIVLPFVRVADVFDGLIARHPSLAALWPQVHVTTAARTEVDTSIQLSGGRLPDPLTERERTVLRWLCTTMSTGEIAEEMCLSVNTVKTHIAAIYRKLAAAKRRDAVLRARTLELL